MNRKPTTLEIAAIHRYTATTAVGASTVRNNPEGTARIARQFLERVAPVELRALTKHEFPDWLNEKTSQLQKCLAQNTNIKRRAKIRRGPGKITFENRFGLSRKILNIYLHNCYFNRILNERCKLERFCDLYEVPIDDYTQSWIIHLAREAELDAKSIENKATIYKLTPSRNSLLQIYAEDIALLLGTSRVFLDPLFYRQDDAEFYFVNEFV